MFWNYVQFTDETQVAYSDLHDDGTIEVRIERPIDMGFDEAVCVLPGYKWSNADGFTDEEIAQLEAFLRSNTMQILKEASLRQGLSRGYEDLLNGRMRSWEQAKLDADQIRKDRQS